MQRKLPDFVGRRFRFARLRERGAAMVEFVVVGPIITALGLGILQYSLMFFAKSQINHATFMAARAGSVTHANIDSITAAYKKALIPLYGGGQNTAELALSYARAVVDLTPQTLRVEILNPTQQSFDDYATDAELNVHYGARAIPNTSIALRENLDKVAPNSGQTIQDANLLKLRVTHGYQPKVWLMGMIYQKYLQWLDTGADSFNTQLINSGRIPIVSHVTLEMQSDAVEQKNVSDESLFASSPGEGNHGDPRDPGNPKPNEEEPPHCLTMGCSVTYTPSDPGAVGTNGEAGEDGGEPGGCTGANCPVCNG